MFERPHHRAIAKVLRALKSEVLSEAECFFGGGTAVVLALGEYRESVDIDFLCASQKGYRLLREKTFGGILTKLLAPGCGVDFLREVRADQYGIRTQIQVDGVKIKFEIVREARIALAGELDPRLGVPVLSRSDMYAEKLLANADRWADRGVLSRDIIDLSMMVSRWGAVPESAWLKAENAYGETVRIAYQKATNAIRNSIWLDKCLRDMAMEPSLANEILALYGGPLEAV